MEHKIDACWSERVAQLHAFLYRQGFYPAVLSSWLCVGLYLTRVVIGHTWDYYSMLWNLFLAWIPYLSSIWAMHLHEKHPRRWWMLLIPIAIALIFFPNAPYIVTDLLHLKAYWSVPLWFDVGMLATFAWTGIILGIYALKLMQDIVKTWVGTVLSWGFVLVVLGMSGMGIYLGRFLRWNSWDLLIQPKAILYDITVRLRHPFGNLSTYGVTLMFAALMLVCYLALTAGPQSKQRE
ncbi:MAG TPA: DUF1361 domain-containing protein [Anaerolineae bacterium]|nr:DUF1361 domain-containing protein [Anaerolineae bacterium]HQH37961.1 DUF1361 domain-containing protein [Anaerolineae bacterium]